MERAELRGIVRELDCARERNGAVFLCDPAWAVAERVRVDERLRQAEKSNEGDGAGWLMIPTGGTSGRVKFARHDEVTITAAVRGFCGHFDLERVNAVGMLPMHHVSGLMARLRCAATGGSYVPWNWADMKRGERPDLARGEKWVVSLVPTQLQRLLESADAVAWLRKFEIIFVGGGPTWPELADAAAREELRVSLTYGMTETAAMVAALRPGEFLAGERSSGTALPHARVTVGRLGTLRVESAAVFRGYFPERSTERAFETEDRGEVDAAGHVHVAGRRDAVIITGGKKVSSAAVEEALRASGEFSDVAVIGVPDPTWGEAVVACYPAGGRAPDVARAAGGLTGAQRPKHFVAIDPWPRNAQGKLNRAALVAAAVAEKKLTG